MIVNIVLFIFIFALLGRIIILLLSKFSLAASIDLKQLPQEKHYQIKRQLILNYLGRNINSLKLRIKNRVHRSING